MTTTPPVTPGAPPAGAPQPGAAPAPAAAPDDAATAPTGTAEDAARKRRRTAAAAGQSPPPVAAAPQQAAEGAAKRGWVPPKPAQYGISTVFDHLYGITLGPVIRQTSSRLVGEKYTKPFKPPNTPGYVVRELIYGIGTTVAADELMEALLKATTNKGSGMNMLTTAGGFVTANAASTAGMTVAAATQAFRMMLVRNLGLTAAFAAIDAVFASKIGPPIEKRVNQMFGKNEHTEVKDVRGGVPLSTVKQTFEQGTRSFARSFVAMTSYTLLWKEIGLVLSRSLFTSMGGGVAAGFAAAIGGALATSLVNHVVIWGIGEGACDLAQNGVRMIKKALGKPLDKEPPKDVVATIGDRVNMSFGNVLVPFLTAVVTNQRGQFMAGLKPR